MAIDADRYVQNVRFLLGNECIGLRVAEFTNGDPEVNDVLFGPFDFR